MSRIPMCGCYVFNGIGSVEKYYQNNKTNCERCQTELYGDDFGGPCHEHGCNKHYCWECWRKLHPEFCSYCGVLTCCKKNIKLVLYETYTLGGIVSNAYACQKCVKKLDKK